MAEQDNSVPGTGSGNTYIDSLIWGCGWDMTDGPITVHFGEGEIPDIPGTFGLVWTQDEIDAFVVVFDNYEAVCGLDFEIVDTNAEADMVEWKLDQSFFEPNVLASHEVPDETYAQIYGYYNSDASGWGNFTPGNDVYYTLQHELGHAVGLAHPHDGGGEDDATIFPGVTDPFNTGDNELNQAIWTIMSYNRGWDDVPPPPGVAYGTASTLMAFDIAALQYLYGANMTYNTGADTYVLPTVNAVGTGWSCIWDAGGSDTISNAGFSGACTINLNDAPLTGANAAGYVSSVTDIVGGFTIANGAQIENAVGGSGSDTLIGNELANTLSGGAGDDTLQGNSGNDTLNGGDNNDTLNGGDNNDTLIGQDGNDTLNGGNGIDTASYVGATGAVTVALGTTTAQNTVGDGTDTLSSIENLIGSNFADTLSGTSGDNTVSGGGSSDNVKGFGGNDTLNGEAGDDTLNGGASNDTLNGGDNNDTLIGQDGNDTLAGGSGTDTASYVGAVAGVTVALSVATAQNTVGDGTDTLSSMENLIGSNFVDTLSGTSGDNTISGGGNNDTLTGYSGLDTLNGDNGNDTLNGGASNDTLNGGADNDTLIGQDGNDTLAGGSGVDTASYVGAIAGVTVALATTTAQNTVGDGTDTLSSIENLIGSNFVDTLSGTSGDNTISGGGNNDTLTGYSGNDTLNGDNGNDTLNGGANNDTLNGGENNDTLIGQDGNDTLAGGNGIDTASYVGAIAGVTVSLATTTAQNTVGDGTDTLSSIENLIGSNFVDTLSGTSGDNTISSGGNNDDVKGFGGVDVLNGDNGNDKLNGGASNDTLNGGANDDVLIGQEGDDTLTSGSGLDDFIFDDGHGADTVTDFQNGSDQFNLAAVTGIDDIGDLTITDNGATVTVNYGTGSFTVTNLADPAQLDASDFLF